MAALHADSRLPVSLSVIRFSRFKPRNSFYYRNICYFAIFTYLIRKISVKLISFLLPRGSIWKPFSRTLLDCFENCPKDGESVIYSFGGLPCWRLTCPCYPLRCAF